MATYEIWPFIQGATTFINKFAYDGSGNQIYIGWAQAGTASSSTGWRIMQQTFNGSNQLTDITWPNASTAFDFIWDNRATYSYS